jgi:hypothetical protein
MPHDHKGERIMINVARALEHPFQDKDWATKMLIGAGISLVPVLNFALNGYALDVLHNTSRGEDVPLPKWDDLGRQFVEGAKLFVVQLIYSIPIMVIVFVSLLIGVGMGLAEKRGPAWAQDVLAILAIGMTGLSLLYGLVFAFLTPAMYIQVARIGTIGSAFRFNEIAALFRRREGDYIFVVVLPAVLGVVIALVFSVIFLIPFIGFCLIIPFIVLVFLATPYYYIISGHLYGQLERP